MSKKRTTIYDIARELGISGSYVSKALNGHPSISKKMSALVAEKAAQMHYKHNSHAANLRMGASKTIGVVVPRIDQHFFSQAIAGIEEACSEYGYGLIICQSDEQYDKEVKAIDTLIRHNVDCILISISRETKSTAHLEEIIKHNILLIQFDRCLADFPGIKVENDNTSVSKAIVAQLYGAGYRKIAFIGGPENIPVFLDRKLGFLQGIAEQKLEIPSQYIKENILNKEDGIKAATELLQLPAKPDAVVTVTDYTALSVLQVAQSMNLKVPEEVGIFGFANEPFTELIQPALSTVDQQSKELGKCAANLFFENMDRLPVLQDLNKQVIPCKIIVRQSSDPYRNQ